jgi:phytoene/squalene synthetase
MARFGCTEEDLAQPATNPVTKRLMTFEAARANKLLDDGALLVGTLKGSARLAVAGYVAGGRAALAAIEAEDYDVLRVTPRPRKPVMIKELAKAYLRGR